MLIATALALVPVGCTPQEPPVSERERLAEEFLEMADRIRGGRVGAHWLADGSSLVYRDGARRMFLDPADGAPRRATTEEWKLRSPVRKALRGGRLHSPSDERWVELEGGVPTLHGEGTAVQLAEDSREDVYWVMDERGWAPDGSAVVLQRYDARDVFHLPVIDYGAALEVLVSRPYIKTGTALARVSLAVFDAEDGTRVDVAAGTDEEHYVYPLGWRGDGAELLFLRMNRVASRLDLMAASPKSGKSRIVLTETRETFIGGLDFHMGGWRDVYHALPQSDGFLWLSERDGWRHVYHYGYDGALLSRVTSGEFPVLRVMDVDEAHDRVFVLANAEERLYDTHLYRVELAGGDLLRLTEGEGEHAVQLAPSMSSFVDVHSSLDRPPVSELRDLDGELIHVLARADASRLEMAGWSPPEAFVAKAADGETDLYGVLFKPAWFDPAAQYPIIDVIYSGPFMTIVPNDYGSASPFARRAQAMAQLGFIVALIDPRGTTERSKEFQDASFGRIGEIEIPDHVAALREAASTRPWMDLERVGVYGHSWGGYFALRAMLTAPGFFRVGVSSAPGELTEAAVINEPYMGTPASNPTGYAAGINAPLAANLEGELLIIHGTADVNAPFSTSMRMVAALIEADRPFDLLVLPGATHSYQGAQARYATSRIREHFLEHLRGESLDD